MRILITGGAGYIGSTVASACLDAGHEVVVLDDLSAGRAEFVRDRTFYRGSIGDDALLDRILGEQAIDAVVHCAAKIVVPESVAHPLAYYRNNVGMTLTLLGALSRHHVTKLLFSSSASIYAPDDDFQVDEGSALEPQSPYARTKLMTEMILSDLAAACDLRVISLRYFNPIGTDPQLRTGQQIERPTHVLGRLIEAWQTGSTFTVTGVGWPTRDGSGIRDFIHVWDLARAHVAALERFDAATASAPHQAINIGTGRGVTVRELLTAFERVSGVRLRSVDGPPRPGDVCGVYTRSGKAERLLGWRAELSETDAIRDAIAWLPKRKELLGY